jgi:hypothetical protein
MSQTYFSKFPLINYNGQVAVNISERVSLLDTVAKNPYLYYPYDLDNELRIDQVAGSYYSDSYMGWLVCLANNITDPYYGWYLSNNDFNEFLISKYGSVRNAQTKILYYRNNWYDNLTTIAVSYYDALPSNLLKYYTPVYGYNNKIIAYTRVQEDWTVNTNKVVTFSCLYASPFIKGETVTVSFPDLNENGSGTVVYSDGNELSIQNIIGYVFPLSDSYMVFHGETSDNFVSIISSDDLVINQYNNILPTEEVYYSPVTAYDYEVEKNEANKSIRLLDNSYSTQVSVELTNLLGTN